MAEGCLAQGMSLRAAVRECKGGRNVLRPNTQQPEYAEDVQFGETHIKEI